MIAWWHCFGWAFLALGVGIGVLGLTGNEGWLEQADQSARGQIARAAFTQEFGAHWQWQEHDRKENTWLWQGYAPMEVKDVPVLRVEMDGKESVEFDNELLGPISLAVLLKKLEGRVEQVVVRSWPFSWAGASGATGPLQEALESLGAQEQQGGVGVDVVAAFGLKWDALPRAEQLSALAVLRALPITISEEILAKMNLLEVNAASLGWPPELGLAEVLWAGVPVSVLANYEREGIMVRVPLLLRFEQKLVPSLPLMAALDLAQVRASELSLEQVEGRWGEVEFLLRAGNGFEVRLDHQGRMAVPLNMVEAAKSKKVRAEDGNRDGGRDSGGLREGELGVTEKAGAGDLMSISMEDFLPLLHSVEVSGLEQGFEKEALAGSAESGASFSQSLMEGKRVLWLDAVSSEGVGASEARAFVQMVAANGQAQERELRVNRPLGAASLVVLALVLARLKRRSHLSEGMLCLMSLLFLGMLAYLSLRLGQWWVSPLPGVVVIALMLFFRERQRWVQAARENLLAEQLAENER